MFTHIRIDGSRGWLWYATVVASIAVVLLVCSWLLRAVLPGIGVRWALDRLENDFGIVGRGEISLSLLPLRVRVEDFSMAASDFEDEPFLTVAEASVDLPWSVVVGVRQLGHVQLVEPAVVVHQVLDGISNLPRFADTRMSDQVSPPHQDGGLFWQMSALSVEGATITWRDEARDIDLRVGPAGLHLNQAAADRQSVAGRLTLAEPVRLTSGHRGTAIVLLDTPLTVSPTTVTVGGLVAIGPEGRVEAGGDVMLGAVPPSIELDYGLDLSLERLEGWFDQPFGVTGDMQIAGRVDGALSSPSVSVLLSSPRLTWNEVELVEVSVGARFDGEQLTLQEFSAQVGGGVVEVAGAVTFADRETSGDARLTWNDIRTDALPASVWPDRVRRVSTVLGGVADVSWAGHEPADLTATVQVDHESPTTDGLPIQGGWRVDAAEGTWRLMIDALSVGPVLVTSAAVATLPASWSEWRDTGITGDLMVEVHDLNRLADELVHLGFTDAMATAAPSGTASIHLNLSESLGMLAWRGELSATGRVLGLSDEMALQAVVSRREGMWRLSDMDMRLAGSHLHAVASGGIASGELAGDLTWTIPDVGRFATVLPPEWRPEGAFSIDANLRGLWGHPSVVARVTGADVQLVGQTAERLEGRVTFDRQKIQVETLQMHQADGVLALAVGINSETGTYVASASGQNVRLTSWHVGEQQVIPFSGWSDFELNGEGRVADPRGSGQVVIRDLEYAGSVVDRMDHEFAFEPDAWRLHSAVPSLGAFGDLVVDPDSWEYRLNARLEEADLGRVVQLWTPSVDQVEGTVTLRVEAAGSLMTPALSDVSVDLDRLEARVQEIPVILGAPVRVRSSVEGVELDGDFQLEVGGGRVVARGGMRGDGADVLTVRVRGDLRDLHVPTAVFAGGADAEMEGGPVQLSGPFRVEAEVTGSVARPVLTAVFSLDDAVIGAGKTAPLTDLTVRARYDGTGLSLGEFRGRWDNATITALGFVPVRLLAPYLGLGIESSAETTNSARLQVRLDGVRPGVLSGVMDPAALEELDGELGVALDLEADAFDLAAVRAIGSLPVLDLRVAGLPITQRGQTRVRFEHGRLAVERFAWRFGAAETVLTLGGEVEMLPEPTAKLTVTGTADLSVLNAFSPAAALGGAVSVAVNLGGTIAQPSITGAMEVMDGEVRIAEPSFWLADLNGGLVFQGTSMQSIELGGTANGGAVQLDVDLEFPGLRPQGTLGVLGQAIPVVLPPGIRTELETSLVLTLGEVDTELGGTVTILRGDYREPVNTAGGLRALMTSSSDLELLDMDPSALDRLRLDVRVRTEEEIVVNNNYGVGTLGGDVRVVGTWGQPGVVGRATVGDGSQLFLGGNRFEIDTGTIDFSDPDGVTLELDVAASTRVGANVISLTLEGTADTLTSTLEAEPALPESDIVSLLLTGRRLDEVESAPGVAARDQALGLVSGEVLGVVGRSVGLDTVRLDRSSTQGNVRFDDSLVAGEANPGTRLTVGKNVSRQVELVASQNLRESGRVTWIVNFLPRRNVELRLVVDDETDRSYEFRHAIRFGATGPRRVTSAPSSVPLVAAVHVVGDGPLSESELRGLVRVRAGDRFNFVRWQESRERIEEALWQLGFLEASVRARRSIQDAEGVENVVLEFEVRAGPRTSLDVQGYRPPRRVRRAMEAAWRRAVGDVFLFEELTDLMRRYLVEQGYLRPVVTVDVVVDPDEARFERKRSSKKRIIVSIEPGPRFRDRAIQFAGEQRLTPTQLSRLLTVDRANDAWVGGDALTRAVLATAQGEGLLAATTRVGPPVFKGDAATLTVELEEGPVFRVDEVVIDGAERWSAEQVLAASRVVPGQIFRPRVSEQIRTAILLAYRRAGFAMARVGVRSIVDRSRGTVTIRVEVTEGRRQLLTSVEVEGAVVTHPRVVDRALRLMPGTPVDPVTWSEARKRLYESGVFRSVDITAVPAPVTSVEPSGDDQLVTAKVLLEEWPLYRLRYGLQLIDERAPMGGVDTRGAIGAVADLTRQNLFGRAIRLGTAIRYDAIQKVGRGFMVFPSFLGRPMRSQLFVSRLRKVFGPEGARAISDRAGVTLEQRIEPREGLTVSYSYSWDRDRTLEQRLDRDDPRVLDVSVDIARVNGSVIIEDRDDIFDTTKGAFHSSTMEWGVQALGSERRMFKYVGQQNYFRPLGHGVVLASAVRLGLGTGFGPKLLRSERFYAGGGTTVRGYPQDALGPVDALGNASGGDALIVFNQEVRFPVWGRVGGVGFLDAGNVFPAVDDVSLTELQVGTGLGLRVGTPVGLFRIDYGIPLSEGAIDAKGRWFVSIGQAF